MKFFYLTTLALLFSASSFAQLPSHVPSNGLQGWWTFSGNTNDSSGNGNNGIAYGVSLTSDRKGKTNSAYEFDITSAGWGTAKDRIEITQNSKVMDSLYKSQAFSISCWVKLKPKTGGFAGRPHTIFGVWDGGNKTSFIRFQVAKQGSNNNTFSTFNPYNPKFGNTKISDSVWSQIVITYDKDSSKLNYYLNSILDTSITMTYSIPSSTNYGNLTFGEVYMANGHWYHFNGSLDDIGIWNRALTPSEVSNLFNESIALSLKFVSFDARAASMHTANLKWTTASEINNSHFEIERSYDGGTFEMIGQVAGKGNSHHQMEYNYIDNGIHPSNKIAFYRLKQVDFNGTSEYSTIQFVRFDELGSGIYFSAYPNPASIELNIKIESNLLGSQFRIINTLGQEVRQGELSKLISTIDVSKLPKGSYNMLIGTENYSHPFLVE